ncbi:MAG TPA: PH domain-containing protein [Egibacteraceae bacterium]|nr:PH domain-containing protein [Egibacteraceae bacterium]
MGYPQRLLTEDEVVVHDFHPHWKMLAPAVLAAALAGGAIYGVWNVPPVARSADQISTLVIALVAGAYVASVALRWWFTQYVLTSERLIVRQGVLSRSGLEIPLEQINNVSFSQTIGERLLRFGDLVIESAGSTGQSQIDNIPDPQAFQSEIYRTRDVSLSDRWGGGTALSVVEHLERLEGLRDRGTLTQEEFDAKKRELLDGG